jgi:4-hydroxythreonine-4-phosphate dehydrogenase
MAAKSDKEIGPIAITMGEPAGVGPKLIGRAWEKRQDLSLPVFAFIGDASVLKLHCPNVTIQRIDDIREASKVFRTALPVLSGDHKADQTILGTLNPDTGAATIESIDIGVDLALNGDASAVVTAPIHKANLYEAGFNSPGHTEYLSKRCGLPAEHSVMMLATEGLRVVPVTKHIAIKDVAAKLTHQQIYHCGNVLAHDLRTKFGIDKPRIATAGLNPHAGEGGAMGIEEATHIKPAVDLLRDDGIDATDPLPADTLFHAEAREQYDAVLCMYHDQALIPLKTLDFWGGVNITLGLPIIRTSPDHGTALELAATGKARLDSMVAAIRAAETMAKRSPDNGN